MMIPVERLFAVIDLNNPNTFRPARFGNINEMVGLLIPLLTIIAVIVFGAMLLSAGYTVITAGGEPEKMQEAQKTATNAIIGILIIVLAGLIVGVLGFLFNIQIPV